MCSEHMTYLWHTRCRCFQLCSFQPSADSNTSPAPDAALLRYCPLQARDPLPISQAGTPGVWEMGGVEMR